jgi:hypothetical protein
MMCRDTDMPREGLILIRHDTYTSCRCIDKAGGLDSYILQTTDKKLASDFGSALRSKLQAVLKARAATASAAVARALRAQHSQLPPAQAAQITLARTHFWTSQSLLRESGVSYTGDTALR